MFKKFSFSDVLFFFLLILFVIPSTRAKIMGLFTFSPDVIAAENQISLKSYNWNLKAKDNNIINFNDFKGQVVLVNFWATWCPPCIAEMPSIDRLYKDYKDKIAFVTVSQEKWKKIDEFMKKNKFSLPVYQPVTQIPIEFHTESIPATFILDKDGKIVVNKKGAADWNSKKLRRTLDKLLGY